ncbi:Uncharacterized protein APZ42_003230, partial [Daphnia magna]
VVCHHLGPCPRNAGHPTPQALISTHWPQSRPKMSMDIILITGMSGSGKSVALHALEDAGYYCVDNLPPELLIPFVKLEEQHKEQRLAIAIDVRSANSLHLMPEQMNLL